MPLFMLASTGWSELLLPDVDYAVDDNIKSRTCNTEQEYDQAPVVSENISSIVLKLYIYLVPNYAALT